MVHVLVTCIKTFASVYLFHELDHHIFESFLVRYHFGPVSEERGFFWTMSPRISIPFWFIQFLCNFFAWFRIADGWTFSRVVDNGLRYVITGFAEAVTRTVIAILFWFVTVEQLVHIANVLKFVHFVHALEADWFSKASLSVAPNCDLRSLSNSYVQGMSKLCTDISSSHSISLIFMTSPILSHWIKHLIFGSAL
jgi:hypothetical protein